MFFKYRLAKNKRKYLNYSWELYPLGLTPIPIGERRRTINNVKKANWKGWPHEAAKRAVTQDLHERFWLLVLIFR